MAILNITQFGSTIPPGSASPVPAAPVPPIASAKD
jgi:hypothetical protein